LLNICEIWNGLKQVQHRFQQPDSQDYHGKDEKYMDEPLVCKNASPPAGPPAG
jgi:hypothetical protein